MLSLAFSPCPNDTFIFYALTHERVDLENIKFEYRLHDGETLNEMAVSGGIDMIRVSFSTYLFLHHKYVLLDSGATMGFGNGPIVISRNDYRMEDIQGLKVAIPGQYTTAHMLLNIAVPKVRKKEFMHFSEIEEAVLTGKADAGVIIQENRFTYEEKGLRKVLDLGEYWETQMGSPIPLGGIIARKGLGYNRINKLNRIMHRSVDFAMNHPDNAMPFVRKHAREMDETVMQKYIGLYVNQNTLSLGTGGRVALVKFQEIARERGLIDEVAR